MTRSTFRPLRTRRTPLAPAAVSSPSSSAARKTAVTRPRASHWLTLGTAAIASVSLSG